jgi:hypothetical protein
MTLPFMREADRLEGAEAPASRAPLRLDAMLGDWINTNPGSRGIVRVVVEARGGGLAIRAFGAGSPPRDWGETAAEALYADGARSDHGMAWTARYDFGFLESHLQGNVNQGLLIVAAFNRFTDGSGRSSYFSREFYRHGNAADQP